VQIDIPPNLTTSTKSESSNNINSSAKSKEHSLFLEEFKSGPQRPQVPLLVIERDASVAGSLAGSTFLHQLLAMASRVGPRDRAILLGMLGIDDHWGPGPEFDDGCNLISTFQQKWMQAELAAKSDSILGGSTKEYNVVCMRVLNVSSAKVTSTHRGL
jgi:hypothetical protein